MRRNTVLLAGLSALLLGFTPAAHAEQIFGLVGGSTIVTFDSAAPGTILATRSITNLNAGELIQAIDLRPQDGLLYGYSTQNRIVNFTLGANAAANPVFAPTVGTNNTTATTPLSTFPPTGQVSIDFNPAANALRLEDVSDNNYRVPFATFPSVTTVFNDGVLRVSTPGDFGQAVGVAYTNNFPGAATTELFVIDAATNALFLQSSPNNGTLTPRGSGFGFDVPLGAVGFDISSSSGIAYLSANTLGGPEAELYIVNLAAGTASLVGQIGGGTLVVQDIAAATAVPEPSTIGIASFGVGALGLLRYARSRRKATA